MNQFPRSLLALALPSLLPALLSIFFLFALHPFGVGAGPVTSFLLYVATQLLWLLPLAAFFVGLDRWRRGYTRVGVAVLLVGLLLSLLDVVILIASW